MKRFSKLIRWISRLSKKIWYKEMKKKKNMITMISKITSIYTKTKVNWKISKKMRKKNIKVNS